MTMLLLVAMSHVAADARIEVDVTRREATPVPRTFFGQFGEHLGLSIYGGKWAQLLRNPSFEGYDVYECEVGHVPRWMGLPDIAAGRDRGLACYWLPVGEATYALDDDQPFNSRWSQRVEVKASGGLQSPLMLPLHRERDYVLSFYARTGEAAQMHVRLGTGEIFGECEVMVDGAAWKRYEVSLTVPDGPSAGDLCYLTLDIEGPATVWLDQAELFPADHVDGFDPDALELMKELNVSLLRFPGGNFVSGYHWRDGIGPREHRVVMGNPAWPVVELNHMGTDEWVAYARAIGAEPFICVNCGDGTPKEAADWVRYCNEPGDGPVGRLRAANGHPEPYAVRYWEVGNELWGSWQVGHCTPEVYAERYAAFSKAMLEADPDILLIANGGPGDWNARFLRAVEAPVRSLSIHRLIHGGVPKETPAEEVAMGLAAYGLDFDRQLDAMQDLFAGLGHADTKVAITELMSFATRPQGPRTCSRHAEIVYYAGMINACIRHRGFVELVTRTATINHGGGRAKIREVAFPEPIHFLSKIYGTMRGRWPVACRVSAPTFITRVPSLPPFETVPSLECMALVDDTGEELTLLVTNRDAGQAHTATLQVDGMRPSGKAHTRTIAGHPDEVNVWNEPPRVAIIQGEIEAGTRFEHAFPPCSFTEIVLTRGN